MNDKTKLYEFLVECGRRGLHVPRVAESPDTRKYYVSNNNAEPEWQVELSAGEIGYVKVGDVKWANHVGWMTVAEAVELVAKYIETGNGGAWDDPVFRKAEAV